MDHHLRRLRLLAYHTVQQSSFSLSASFAGRASDSSGILSDHANDYYSEGGKKMMQVKAKLILQVIF